MVGATDRCPMTNTSASETNAPQYVFVGAFEGVNCWPGGEVHDIWAKFIVNVYLEGGQRFSIDGVSFNACAGHGASRRQRVLMINVKQDAALVFAGGDGGGKRLRKVMTSAPSSWLETVMAKGAGHSPMLERFFSEHLSSFTFEPGLDLIELAEQISNPPQTLTGELLNLYRKSRGLEIMRLACAALVSSAGDGAHRPLLMSARQSERVRDYIMANLSEDLSIEAIARHTGASASSVQRHFKQHFGVTVFDFIRRKRLDAAREALERKGVTVMQAAWIAGYMSPSSFIAAFRKTYGTSPGGMRA